MRPPARDGGGIANQTFVQHVRNGGSLAGFPGAPVDNQSHQRIALERDADSRAGSVRPSARIRTDADAAATADALGARAVTIGSDVMFGSGQPGPGTPQGDRVLAHELVHVQQFRDGDVPPGMALGWPGFFSPARDPADETADPDRADDAAPPSPADPKQEDIKPEEVEDVELVFNDDDDAGFAQPVNDVLVPEEATSAEIAKTLYGDSKHEGGWTRDGRRVAMVTLDGVKSEHAAHFRRLIDADNQSDVDWLVAKVSERRIDGDDERAMISRIAWWSDRGELRDDTGKSYFDVLCDRLQAITLSEWGLFSDDKHNALEWIIIESEEKKGQLIDLLAKRGVRKATDPYSGDDAGPKPGPLDPKSKWGAPVGKYTTEKPTEWYKLYSTDYFAKDIRATKQLPIEETTADRAVEELRNSPETGPRVMIPDGAGKFYAYAVDFKYFKRDFDKDKESEKLTNWWWLYAGTVFVGDGEYHPDYNEGTDDQKAHRKQILDRAVADETQQKGLDFDVLALATVDQRFAMIQNALKTHTADDASLVMRILYATPVADFPKLERKLSTSGVIGELVNSPWPPGVLAGIGRVFTVRAMQAMRVPGEVDTATIPEFTVGFDSDGFYHYAYPRKPTLGDSKALAAADFKATDQVAIGHEQALPGEPTAAMQSTMITIQPAIWRDSNFAANFVRGLRQTLIEDDGDQVGPMLPTQLVKVKNFDGTEHTVTAVEALGLLEMPVGEMASRIIGKHMKGGMWLLAGMQLGRVFGPALLEGLGERSVVETLGKAALTEAGSAALSNVALTAAIDIVDRYRKELEGTAAGRDFLGVFDTVMMLWVAHDVGRIVATGIIPRALKAFDWAIATVKGIDESLMPMRAELEALKRTIARYATPAEAAEAAIAGGGTGAVSETKPGFFSLLRISRGEVAAERLTAKAAGTAAEASTTSVLNRLGSSVERAETDLSRAVTDEEKKAATAVVDRTSRARYDVAQRAAQLKPDARQKFLDAVDAVLKTKPGSVEAMADLLSAAASARQPNVFILEVQKLVGRGVSDETLRVLGAKALVDPPKIDLAWLNSTKISDEALDFLGQDKRTPWDLYRRAAADPTNGKLLRSFRTSARGAGAEMVAETKAATLGTDVRRQVPMGDSEIDFDLIVAGKRRGFEIKGWTTKTWREALDAAVKRIVDGESKLTADEKKLVGKIDHMTKQLGDARAATGEDPMLGLTDALGASDKAKLQRVFENAKLGKVELVPLSETDIKEAAAGKIGEAVGVPRP
jgi:hypothetical protein